MKLNENYNQYDEYYLRNGCSLVTILNIMKYNFNIFVIPSFIIKFAIFFDKLGKWAPGFGAYFSIIYPAFVWNLNRKLGLKFKLIKINISDLKEDSKFTWSLGIKKYGTRKWGKFRSDGNISLIDLDTLQELTGGVAHNLGYTAKMGGKIIDTNGENPIDMSVEALKKGAKLGLFWYPLRTIIPANKETREVVKLTKKMARAEYNGTLGLFYNKQLYNPYLEKAKELYFYGRKKD